MKLHATVAQVTERIAQRSASSRSAYLLRVDAMARRKPATERMGCANVAHALAAMPDDHKAAALARDGRLMLVAERAPNIGIVTAYNDMLSAHAPYQRYPWVFRASLDFSDELIPSWVLASVEYLVKFSISVYETTEIKNKENRETMRITANIFVPIFKFRIRILPYPSLSVIIFMSSLKEIPNCSAA